MSTATTIIHSTLNSSDPQATSHAMQHSFHHQYQQGQQQPQNGSNPRQQMGTPPQQQPPQFYPQYPQFPVQQYPLPPQQQQQFAQWAYQQMMYQQNQLAYQPHGPIQQFPYMNGGYQNPMQQQQQQHQQQQFIQHQQQQQQHQQPQQLHQIPFQPPYARENNGSRTSLGSAASSRSGREDNGRKRTTSNKGPHPPSAMNSRSNSSHSSQTRSSPAPPSASRHHTRVSSSGSQSSAATSHAAAALQTVAANRSYPSSSSSSTAPSPTSSPASSPPSPTGVSSANATKPPAVRQPTKPSPLSQDSSRRLSKDDGDLTDTPQTPQQNHAAVPNPTPAMIKSGGLTGRLRRALSFSAVNTLEGGHSGGSSGGPGGDLGSHEKLGSRRQVVAAKLTSEGQIPASRGHMRRPSEESSSTLRHEGAVIAPMPSNVTEGSIRSTTTNITKPKKKSLFNAKFNASTDNISLSSTVSSASMMIRKLGSVGQLARRNSLMKISKLFKDKEKKKAGSDGEGEDEPSTSGKKGKGKKSVKADKSEASVTHATMEVERGTNSVTAASGDEMVGLSPAAKLARQHTLRTNAAEAARAKAEREARDKESKDRDDSAKTSTPTTWENSTTSRAAGRNAFGRPSDISEEDLSSEDGTYDGQHSTRSGSNMAYRDQPQDDSDSEGEEDRDQYDEEDETVRFNAKSDDLEPWAVGLRRSVERNLVPAKGILKHESKFGPALHLPQAPFTRTRSNSYDSAPPNGTEPGPLARIPSPDPDHIDGLHRSGSERGRHTRSMSSSSAHRGDAPGSTPFLPPLKFDADTGPDLSSLTFGTTMTDTPATSEEPSPVLSPSPSAFAYTQPSFNASAPALSVIPTEGSAQPSAAPHPHRSATAPLVSGRRLTFAANLSVYHTFAASVYDRRSEPATCNRLTPALAQRIKEELNSYKMEEMEVHALSRAHTHFFV